MYCQNCGAEIDEQSSFCLRCGSPINQTTENQIQNDATYRAEENYRSFSQDQSNGNNIENQQNQNYTRQTKNEGQYGNNSGSVSFGEAIKLFFHNYSNFTGRASVSEYWWGFLFTFLMSLTIIGSLVCLIGMLSLSIRRLHDIGKSWPWIFIGCVPYVGFIIMIILYCKQSDGDNQWGSGSANIDLSNN